MEIPQRLVEVVARALCDDDSYTVHGLCWNEIPDYHREMYRETSRALIEAMLLECDAREMVRIQFEVNGQKRYTQGGNWDPRPITHHLSRLNNEKKLVIERKLVFEWLLEPIAVQDEEVL
jgi:hypothetical protein